MLTTVRAALLDIATGLRLRRVWIALASEDIDDQHRRTTLGPIWLLLNYLIYVGTFVILFAPAADRSGYAVYVTVGMLVWLYIMDIVNLAAPLFSREESFIAGTTLPLTVYVLRMLMQTLIRTSYAAMGCVIILIFTGAPLGAGLLWALCGIVLLLLVSPATILVLAIGGTFFPDLQYIVSNLMRVGIFLTPVFWVKAPGLRNVLYRWNPFTYFLDIVRAPIISGVFPLHSFVLCVVITGVLWVAAIVLLGKYRRQIVFLL